MMREAERADWLAWRRRRHDELAGPDSWLGLTGLYWLEAGGNAVGSGEACPVRLPGGLPYLGELQVAGGTVTWRPAAGPIRELASDRDGEPTTVDHENCPFFIVDRDGRLAVRVRDRGWAAKRPFGGVEAYGYDPAWRVEAEWQSLPAAPTVAGEPAPVAVARRAVFAVGGQVVALLPTAVDETGALFVFRDRTSGRETYGAGRFLKAAPAVDGKVRLDFNFAYLPPCAFTPFATCPLPPPENRLPFAVPAGERGRGE